MIIDEKILETAIAVSAMTNSLSVYSKDAARVLRYSDEVINGYHKGVFAADVIDDVIKDVYPSLWTAVCGKVPSSIRRDYVKCPHCGGWYISDQETKQTAPDLGEIDKDILAKVEKVLESRSSRLISVYGARVTTVLRYLSLTELSFSMSGAGADMLEIGLAELYPEFFETLEECINRKQNNPFVHIKTDRGEGYAIDIEEYNIYYDSVEGNFRRFLYDDNKYSGNRASSVRARRRLMMRYTVFEDSMKGK